ncbi:MAG: GNAT family N-acetyltransferase [Candidatus Izemoplasma sp.]|nr:GNAT family N-acetyltransferase [Candidatus Izemoplasma sp.]
MTNISNKQNSTIRCRLFNMDDFNALQAIYSNEDVCKYLPVKGVVLDDKIYTILTRYADTLLYPNEGIVYAVTLHGIIIGYTGLKYVKAYEQYEIYYGLHPDYWGKGYATQAALLMKKEAIKKGYTEVVAFAHIENKASQRILEKIGYHKVEQISLWKLPLYRYYMAL